MQALLDDPMVQAGAAPFLVALVVACLLLSTRVAWLAIVAGVATTIALSTGIGFTPLSASRKIVLLLLLAPVAALAIDALRPSLRALPAGVAAIAGLAGAWVFASVLAQRDAADAWALGGGMALFVASLVGLTLRLRDDGPAAGAAALGLGLAVGVSAILSASLGNMLNGVALAASAAALLLIQFIANRQVWPGWLGALGVGLPAALFAAATFVLAELRWPALVLLMLVPIAARAPLAVGRSPRLRAAVLGLACVAAAVPTILAAWLATRFPAT